MVGKWICWIDLEHFELFELLCAVVRLHQLEKNLTSKVEFVYRTTSRVTMPRLRLLSKKIFILRFHFSSQGAMYMMIGIDLDHFPKYSTCLEFTQGLTKEQSVQTFPGFPCFFFASYFRIVLTVPGDLIEEACKRIKEFCEDNHKNDVHGKFLKKG